MKKNIIFGMLVSLLAIPTFAQEQAVVAPEQAPEAAEQVAQDSASLKVTAREHFTAGSTISLGFGLAGSNLAVKGDNVFAQKFGLGYNASLRYTYYVYKYMGITTGVDFSVFSNTLGMKDRLNFASQAPSYETGKTYDYYRFTTFGEGGASTFSEVENIYMLEVPIALTFKYMPNRVGLIGTVGMKLGFPIQGTYQSKGSLSISNDFYEKGFVEQNVLVDSKFDEGVYTYDRNVWSVVNGSVFAEFGALFNVHPRLDLALSVFGSYGVNNICATNSELGFATKSNKFGEYGAPAMADYKGLLGTNAISSANPWCVGGKLTLQINCRKKSDETIAAEAYIEPDVVYVYDTIHQVINRVIRDTVFENVYLVDSVTSWILADNQRVYYKLGDAIHPTISPENLIELLASSLIGNRDAKIIVEGHASADGQRSYNNRLAYRRAETIVNMLKERGVKDEQMEIRTVTKEPTKENLSDEEALIRDRRVTIIPVKPDNQK